MTETLILDERAVEEIEARATAATKDPWVNPYHRCEVYQTLPDDEPHVESGWGRHYTKVQGVCRTEKFEDGDFIAHAREDIPALCATVKQLMERLAQTKTARDQLSGGLSVRDSQLQALQSQLEQLRAENERLKSERMIVREDAERFITQYLHSAQWEGERLMITFENESLIAALIGDVEKL